MDILQEIDSQFQSRFAETVEKVVVDQHEARSFYVSYKSKEARRRIAVSGFRIGQAHIPAEKGKIPAYIPHVAYYMKKQDIDDLLKPYGTVTDGKFRRDTVS